MGTKKRKTLGCLPLLLNLLPFTDAVIPQIPLALIDTMPNLPQPWVRVDWNGLARNQTSFVFSFSPHGPDTPLLWWDDADNNFQQRTFGTPSYVRGGGPSGTNHEAIAGAGLVLSGYLSGLNMSCLSGVGFSCVDFESMLLNYYDRTLGGYIFTDALNPVGEFWYQVWMTMVPMMVSYSGNGIRSPGGGGGTVGPLSAALLNSSLRWYEIEIALGGSSTSLPNFNYTGISFNTSTGAVSGYENGRFSQPVAAAGIAWVQYIARAAFGGEAGPNATQYLQGAKWALDYLFTLNYDPYWEVLLPYGAAIAARMNAELHTSYDVGKLLGWIVQDDQTPAHSPFRWGWGVVSDTWGGVDVHGLVASVTDRDGYAFNMDTAAGVTGCLPIARYNASYARALGKWATNALNAARLFYPAFNSPSNQSDWAWVEAVLANTSSFPPISYEGLRKWGFNVTDAGGSPANNLTGPFATGDAKWPPGSVSTNLAVYGSAYTGMYAAVAPAEVDSGVETVLGLDLLALDYYHLDAWSTVLYYNPGDSAVEITVARGGTRELPVNVYDAVSQAILFHNATGPLQVTLGGDSACVLVSYPSSSSLTYDATNGWLLAGGRTIDWASPGLP
jgi:hypothetical protein